MKLLLSALLISTLAYGELHQASKENYTFDEAQRYCRDYDDGGWRTLKIYELFELSGDARFSEGRSYWSANSVISGPSRSSTGSEGDAVIEGTTHGYSAYLKEGDITISPADKQLGVICSDTPQPKRKADFEKTSEGIVDKESEILWQLLDATDKKAKYDFESAQERCESMELSGREWRLPTLDELYGIVSYEHTSPSVDRELFGIMMSRYYWSDDEFGDDEAYVVGFKLGSVATSSKKNSSYIRCVSDLDQ